MASKYFGVVVDTNTGKWNYRLKSNQTKANASLFKLNYDEEIIAAIARESKLINSPSAFDNNDKRNTRNFTVDEYKKLLNLHIRKGGQQNLEDINDTLANSSKEIQSIESSLTVVKNKKKPIPTKEDQLIVKTACADIKEICIKHGQRIYLDVAEYLAKTFFNNDPKLVKSKTPSAGMAASFNLLCTELIKEWEKAPSKTWLYNALDLFTDSIEIKEKDRKVFHTYGKLLPSHQVKLITVHDMDDKVGLIKKTAKEHLTVRKLQKELDKLSGKEVVKSEKTYRSELELLGKYLDKRLEIVKELPKKEKKKLDDYTQVEEFLTESIERVKQFLELEMFD